eukprot:4610603-Lingulodinium_polyedra.AAC.1
MLLALLRRPPVLCRLLRPLLTLLCDGPCSGPLLLLDCDPFGLVLAAFAPDLAVHSLWPTYPAPAAGA